MDIKEERRNSLLGEVFAADSEIRKLQDHIRDLLQRAVYMDIQRLGYVEKITMDSVDAFHYAITPGGHRLYPESMFEEGEERYRPPCMGQDAGMPSKEQETKEEHRYVTYATLPGSEKETVLEGDDLGKLFVKWREMEEKQDPEHKIRNVLVIDTNATSNPSCKYEIATGRDVTPVYLNLPHMSREEFAKTTRYLKENGARFNSTKKLWYVTRDQDPGRFEEFLHEHEQEGSRTSTVRKLADCRREAAAQAQSQPAGERKHERAR